MTETTAAIRWPWHIKVTRTNGKVTENDYSNDFDAPGYAKWASSQPGVERVDLTVSFVAGEAVSMASGEKGRLTSTAVSNCPECGLPGSWNFEDVWCHEGMEAAMNCCREGIEG